MRTSLAMLSANQFNALEQRLVQSVAHDALGYAVLAGQLRILVGDDAQMIDEQVRHDPWSAYEPEFVDRITGPGHLLGLIR